MRARDVLTGWLAQAGIRIGGSRPWDPRVAHERFFGRVVRGGSLALGESYMDGWWECDDLPAFFDRLLRWRNAGAPSLRRALGARLHDFRHRLFNLQGLGRARRVVDAHYELPARLFEPMLGRTMAYTCGYWKDAEDLDAAQEAKLDLICRKLELRPDHKVLEWGSGFGSFARWAAARRGCAVVGVNLSSEQLAFARRFCDGLPVVFHQCDYRAPSQYAAGGRFDRFASIGMFEAIGRRNFRRHMELLHGLLADDALVLLHTIGHEECSSDPWLDRYIFPDGELPTLAQIAASVRGLFQVEDVHNFGLDYARTLAAWEANFRRAWPEIRRGHEALLSERFFRMWVYYLGCCNGAFRARNMHLWQVVLSKGRRREAYRSSR